MHGRPGKSQRTNDFCRSPPGRKGGEGSPGMLGYSDALRIGLERTFCFSGSGTIFG